MAYVYIARLLQNETSDDGGEIEWSRVDIKSTFQVFIYKNILQDKKNFVTIHYNHFSPTSYIPP